MFNLFYHLWQRMLTPAQREQQELLRMKHLEIQKSIMAQQEELRRISEQLLLSTWGPSVLKVSSITVDF